MRDWFRRMSLCSIQATLAVGQPRMSRYRRLKIEGGTCFFTLTLADLLVDHIERLRRTYAKTNGVKQN